MLSMAKTTARSNYVVNLHAHQKEACAKLRSGSILCGGVGTGKSITALGYFYVKECEGVMLANGTLIAPTAPKNLYIITTARKRDTKEWEEECARYGIFSDPDKSVSGIRLVVDSWNNIGKYTKEPEHSFYIFDEQRVVGSGTWVKSFIAISKRSNWILLSATPGDTWMDYIPVFIANGFYKNRTQFLARHAVFSRVTKFPKVERFVETTRLEYLRRQITVVMDYQKKTIPHYEYLAVEFDQSLYSKVADDRWDIYKDEPITDGGGLCYTLRHVVNSDPSRLETTLRLMEQHPRVIIFYNFDYELDILRQLSAIRPLAEWNGHKHEPIPEVEQWVYLVQYTAGAEGWNCVVTDTIIFYSLHYSYKTMTQAAGRIDRLNTPFTDLYYYILRCGAEIDRSISRAVKTKKTFNEKIFWDKTSSRQKHGL